MGGTNYDWEKTISKSKWLQYLKKKYQYPISDVEAKNAALNFKQKIRHKFLVDWVYQIPLTEIRKDWKPKESSNKCKKKGTTNKMKRNRR